MPVMNRWKFRRTLRRLHGKDTGITWVFHTARGTACPACLLLANHDETCGCGHCPERVTEVIHRSLSEVYQDVMKGH